MEFHEKLQELRKSKGLTQEELAEALYVSRTAVSKWESGRGYPSIDSLKEISRFFGVTIDELICPQEMMTAAEDDKRQSIGRYVSVICNAMDILTAVLLFLPVFGNGGKTDVESVSLLAMTGAGLWLKIVFISVIGMTILNGFCTVIISNFDKPAWNKHRVVTGVGLSILGTMLFILSRQPYAGVFYLCILVIKGILVIKSK